MERFKKHIFICINHREEGNPRGCCHAKGGNEISELFKTRLKELNLSTQFRANKSGCLDACEHGATIVVYPEQIWYGGVQPEDVEEIIESHIINNIPVERLLIKDKKFNKDVE